MADAFQAWPRDIDMVWDEWARQGITFRLCAVPFVQPDRLGSALLGQSCVYEGFSVPPELIENGGHLRIERLGMAARVSSRDDGAMLDWPAEDGRAPCWLPLGSTVHLPLPEKGPGNVCKAIALRAVCVENRISVVSFGYQEVQALDLQSDKSKAYVARDLTVLYRSGQLGKRLDEGGQGTAEWLLLELMREMHGSFCSDIVGAAGRVMHSESSVITRWSICFRIICSNTLRQTGPVSACARSGNSCSMKYRVGSTS